MGVLADWQIELEKIIDPFVPEQRLPGKITHGVSSYGYDVRVAREFRVFNPVRGAGKIIDPKNFDQTMLERVDGDHCIIPANSFALGVTVERLTIPRDCLAIVVGKSTVARCGLVVNVTPLEPCLSADHEALTRDGWVGMADIQVGDEVLTRRDDGVAEYRAVERKQERSHSGKLLRFRGRSVDQLVTPDHKLFVHLRNSRNNTSQPLLRAASEVAGKCGYSMDRTVTWQGEPLPDAIEVAGRTWPTVPFLRFLGCWLGDGSAFHGNDGGYHVKLAVVTKDAKRDYFQAVLDELGIRAKLHERGFHFYDKELCLYLRQFGHAKEKFIDRRFLNASPAQLKAILDGLMASDGNAQTNTFTTSSRRLADDAQELAFKTGQAAVVRAVTNAACFGRAMSPALVGYKVRVCGKHMTPKIEPRTHAEVEYEGPVYDITVPNHVFFCRRAGKASWTGNCWTGHVTMEISNTAPIPAKVYAGEGIAQVVFLRADGVAEGIIDYLLGLAVNGYESFQTPDNANENLSRDAFADDAARAIRSAIATRLCRKSYADKGGRYQNQGMAVTLPCASGGSARTVGALDAATAAVVSEAVGLTPAGSAAAEVAGLAEEVAARQQAQAALAAGADRHIAIKDSGHVSEVKPPG